MAQTQEAFKEQLREGHFWEHYVACEMIKYGFCVQLIRAGDGDGGNLESFENRTDLLVGRYNPIRIEVKSREEKFTSKDDFPFGGKPIVTTLSSWNKAVDKPYAFVIVSQITGKMFSIPSRTRETWETRNMWDHKKKYRDNFLIAPQESLRSMNTLIKHLNNLLIDEIEPLPEGYIPMEIA